MNIMLKDGEKINRETFQHICDDISDLENSPRNQINFGSLAYIVNTGELFIANSKLEWQVV